MRRFRGHELQISKDARGRILGFFFGTRENGTRFSDFFAVFWEKFGEKWAENEGEIDEKSTKMRFFFLESKKKLKKGGPKKKKKKKKKKKTAKQTFY
jgi:hypothetical protein